MEAYNTKEFVEEVEQGIRKRLDKAERWARANYEGPTEHLDEYVFEVRNEVLNLIAKAVREQVPEYVAKNQAKVTTLN